MLNSVSVILKKAARKNIDRGGRTNTNTDFQPIAVPPRVKRYQLA